MIKIEHWSDYRCPFCYIADAEFEDMMKTLGDTSDIVLINKAFELDPEAPKRWIILLPTYSQKNMA